MKKIALIIYYGLFKFLPRNETMLIGKVFRWLRFVTCRSIFANCGSGVNVNRSAYFGTGARLSIGDDSSIGERCQVANDTQIGRDVMMAPDVIIFSVGHEISDVNRPMVSQGNTAPKPVVIGDDVWIGQRAIILPGVKVGHGAVIGAASVVTKDVEPYQVVAGNPAKVIRVRQ